MWTVVSLGNSNTQLINVNSASVGINIGALGIAYIITPEQERCLPFAAESVCVCVDMQVVVPMV